MGHEIYDGYRWGGHAQGETVELAFKLGQYEGNGAGGTRRGRDYVERGGTGATQVLVRVIKDHLVVGVGVDRGDEALDDAEALEDYLGDRGQAVGRAGGIGDDRMLAGIVLVVVHTHDDGDVFAFGG